MDPPQRNGQVLRFHQKETEQYHLCLGGAGIPRGDDRRFALRVLDTILGGSTSSRLFQEVREKRGLAYSVYSYASHYADTGQVALYVGTRPDNVGEAVEVIGSELRRLVDDGVSEEELERARDNVKGRTVLSMESTLTRMNRLGSSRPDGRAAAHRRRGAGRLRRGYARRRERAGARASGSRSAWPPPAWAATRTRSGARSRPSRRRSPRHDQRRRLGCRRADGRDGVRRGGGRGRHGAGGPR